LEQAHVDDPHYSKAIADILYNLHRVQFDTGVRGWLLASRGARSTGRSILVAGF
jgi:hypothetical protein